MSASAQSPVLSIVASAPAGIADPRNVFVDSIATVITGSGNKPLPAASIAELSTRIKNFAATLNGSKFTLQIVGHGSPGVIGLGETWNGRYSNDAGTDYYVLDTNPHLLANLLQFKGKFDRVILAGCEVGSAPRTRAVGGATMLFTLQQLWGCRIEAAIGDIDFSNFDTVTGLYNGPVRTSDTFSIVEEPAPGPKAEHVSPETAGPAGDPPVVKAPEVEQADACPPVQFCNLTAARTSFRVPFAAPGLPIAPELNERLIATYRRQRAEKSLPGAIPELEFSIRTTALDSNIEGRAWISLNGTCLVLELPESLPESEQAKFLKEGNSFYQHYVASDDQEALEDETLADLMSLIISM